MAYRTSYGLIQVQNTTTHSWVTLPLKYIRYETYKVTPDQMLDLDSYTSETGLLIRNVLDHTRSKIEFNTPYITNTEFQALLAIIKDGYTKPAERRLRLRYYDPEIDGYRLGYFYRPDIDYTVRNIDGAEINYSEIRIAFIEY